MKNNLLLLLVIFSLTACNKNDDTPSVKPVIPLQTGNTWTYVDSVFSSSGIRTDTVIQVIGDLIHINGQTGFVFNSFENSFHINFLANNDVVGNFVTMGGFSDVDTLLTASVEFKKNAVKGETWTFQHVSVTPYDGIFENRTLKMTCLNTDTSIYVPCGNFICTVYSYSPNSGDDTFVSYISDGIGTVKSEHYENSKLFRVGLLVKYKLN